MRPLESMHMEPVTPSPVVQAVPDTILAGCPQLDVLCVPGGPGVNAAMEDAVVLDFLRAQAAGARYVTSVCTGSLLLGAAGLLGAVRKVVGIVVARPPRI